MLSSTQNVAPKPALPPAAQPVPSAQAGGPSFAQFMTEQASLPTPPAEPAPQQPEAAADAPQPPAAGTATRRAVQPAKPATPARAADAAPKADAKAAPADKAEAQATDAVAPGAEEDDAPETPELKEFAQLIGLNTAAQPDPAAKPELQRSRAGAIASDDLAPARGAGRAVADAGRAAEAPEAAPAKAAKPELRADKADARAAASELLQAADGHAAATQAPASPDTAAPSFAAALAQALPTPAAPAGGAPVASEAAVRAPLHSPAFAPELGASISLLAVDGVQQAELQLNPADMGPVSVQIVVDGSQAQVSFHAAQAETRQALEQSLPELAAALQGQGLTLSGGGVFQQPARDNDHGRHASDAEGADRGAHAGAGRVDGAAAGPATAARRVVGLLDTFA
jgi:flagellar hook-length control protein FliK